VGELPFFISRVRAFPNIESKHALISGVIFDGKALGFTPIFSKALSCELFSSGFLSTVEFALSFVTTPPPLEKSARTPYIFVIYMYPSEKMMIKKITPRNTKKLTITFFIPSYYQNKEPNTSKAPFGAFDYFFFFFALSIALFIASRFFVLRDRDVLFFVFTLILFAIDSTIPY
jgi:hypothetical protein